MNPLFIAMFTCILSAPSLAANFDLQDIPPLTPLKLLTSKLDPDFHILLSEAKGSGDHYLLINLAGRIHSPRLLPNSMTYYDGGTADLYLETGERLVVPTSQQKENYLRTSLGPTLIYADRAPIPFALKAISNRELRRLGFSKFIAPADLRRDSPNRTIADYRMLENLRDLFVVHIQFKRQSEYVLRMEIENRLKELDPDSVRVLKLGHEILFGRADIILLVKADAIPSVQRAVADDAIESMYFFDPKSLANQPRELASDELAQKIADLPKQSSPLKARLEILEGIHHGNFALSELSESEKITLIRFVSDVIGDVDQTHSAIYTFAMHETAVRDFQSGKRGWKYLSQGSKNIARTENHPIVGMLLDPLRRIAQRGFEILDKIEHPIARQMVVEAGNAVFGAGFLLLQGRPSGGQNSYFSEWLDQLRFEWVWNDRTAEARDLTALKALGLRIRSRSGSNLDHLKVDYDLSSLTSTAEKPVYFKRNEMSERVPTVLFGLTGDKETLRRELIGYIIEGDKKAENFAKWKRDADERRSGGQGGDQTFRVRGDDALFSLITGLNYIPFNAREGLPSFSEAEYRWNVIEIYRQLLEIAKTSIVNQATYVAILEASLVAIDYVESEFGLNSRKEPRLAKAAVQLQRVIHRRLMNGLGTLSDFSQHAQACAVLLSPHPWQALRNGRR